MRPAFEAWALSEGFAVEPENGAMSGGRFKWQDTRDAWEGWQAACALCASTLEAMANDADPEDFASIALREAAKEIRGIE